MRLHVRHARRELEREGRRERMDGAEGRAGRGGRSGAEKSCEEGSRYSPGLEARTLRRCSPSVLRELQSTSKRISSFSLSVLARHAHVGEVREWSGSGSGSGSGRRAACVAAVRGNGQRATPQHGMDGIEQTRNGTWRISKTDEVTFVAQPCCRFGPGHP